MTKPTLDERVEPGIKSGTVAGLIEEAKDALEEASKSAELYRTLVLDPRRTAAAVAEVRREMDDAVFKRDRLQAAIPPL